MVMGRWVAGSLRCAALAVGAGRTCAWDVSHSRAQPATGPVARFLQREGAVREVGREISVKIKWIIKCSCK